MDPVVFFKLYLFGYLENIIGDHKLIDHCSMRLDILYFLGYKNDFITERRNNKTSYLLDKKIREQVVFVLTTCSSIRLLRRH
nr:transposase [Aquimarina longa]